MAISLVGGNTGRTNIADVRVEQSLKIFLSTSIMSQLLTVYRKFPPVVIIDDLFKNGWDSLS